MTTRKKPATERPLPEAGAGPGQTDPQPQDPKAQSGQDLASEPALIVDLPQPPPVSSPATRRLWLSGAVLVPIGGIVLAAVVGFALSDANVFGLRPADQTAAVTALTQGQDQLTKDVAALSARLATLETTPPPPPDLSRLDEIDARLTTLEGAAGSDPAATAALSDRLTALEQTVTTLPLDAADAARLDAALTRLAEMEADAKAQADAAAIAAAQAERQLALEALTAAVAGDQSFRDELAALADQGIAASLEPYADGVTTLAQLQADFPDAARAVLQLARQADGDAGWGSRLTDFLADQTGARSVAPREGTDPDAILSRAEFALGEGRLADALAELESLPADLQGPLADLSAKASARLAVESIIAEVN